MQTVYQAKANIRGTVESVISTVSTRDAIDVLMKTYKLDKFKGDIQVNEIDYSYNKLEFRPFEHRSQVVMLSTYRELGF